ncbi:MAG: hypothetical protein EZS28_042651, partial [Streblomastix strix]
YEQAEHDKQRTRRRIRHKEKVEQQKAKERERIQRERLESGETTTQSDIEEDDEELSTRRESMMSFESEEEAEDDEVAQVTSDIRKISQLEDRASRVREKLDEDLYDRYQKVLNKHYDSMTSEREKVQAMKEKLRAWLLEKMDEENKAWEKQSIRSSDRIVTVKDLHQKALVSVNERVIAAHENKEELEQWGNRRLQLSNIAEMEDRQRAKEEADKFQNDVDHTQEYLLKRRVDREDMQQKADELRTDQIDEASDRRNGVERLLKEKKNEGEERLFKRLQEDLEHSKLLLKAFQNNIKRMTEEVGQKEAIVKVRRKKRKPGEQYDPQDDNQFTGATGDIVNDLIGYDDDDNYETVKERRVIYCGTDTEQLMNTEEKKAKDFKQYVTNELGTDEPLMTDIENRIVTLIQKVSSTSERTKGIDNSLLDMASVLKVLEAEVFNLEMRRDQEEAASKETVSEVDRLWEDPQEQLRNTNHYVQVIHKSMDDQSRFEDEILAYFKAGFGRSMRTVRETMEAIDDQTAARAKSLEVNAGEKLRATEAAAEKQ